MLQKKKKVNMVHADVMVYASARLRFSQQCFWSFKSSEMCMQCHRVNSLLCLKDRSAHIFMGNKSKNSYTA